MNFFDKNNNLFCIFLYKSLVKGKYNIFNLKVEYSKRSRCLKIDILLYIIFKLVFKKTYYFTIYNFVFIVI